MKKAKNALVGFIENAFNIDDSYKSTDHQPNPSKHNCKYCAYRQLKSLCSEGI